MFNPTREQVRRFFCDAWKKHLDRLPLVGAEVTAADIALRHPEYHALLTDAEAAVNKDWVPEGGEMNPFLHLSLHLAIHEQISIDSRRAFVWLSSNYGRAWSRTPPSMCCSNAWARRSGKPSAMARRWMRRPMSTPCAARQACSE